MGQRERVASCWLRASRRARAFTVTTPRKFSIANRSSTQYRGPRSALVRVSTLSREVHGRLQPLV